MINLQIIESRETLRVFEEENGCHHKCNKAEDVGVRKVRFILPNETM